MSDLVEVTFAPAGIAVEVPAGTSIYEAAQAADVSVDGLCGGNGICGKCQVVVTGRVSELTGQETEHLGVELLERGTRLACQARALGDASVRIPSQERIVVRKDMEADTVRSVPLDANVQRYDLELPAPSLEDQRSDFQRLADAVSEYQPELSASASSLRNLAGTLRTGEHKVSVTVIGDELVDVRPAFARSPCLGVAADIGTSTVAVYLVDLETGLQLAAAAAENPQAQFGADVISRIEYSNSNAEGLATLQAEAVGVVNQLIGEAVAHVGAQPQDVYEITVVGNTCMQHIFLGLDPRHLAESPYVPVSTEAITSRATDVGLDVHPRGQVFCLPCIAGFVGADTVGVIVASELTRRSRPALAVDIGTNGEVALWSGERLLTASCAAGPAFEGAQIEQGMRAAAGAIDHVFALDGDIGFGTIGGEPARGICGSGLFDAVAVLLDLGLLDKTGRIVDSETSAAMPAVLAQRLAGEGPDRRVILTEPSESGNSAVALTQRDIREVQLAKGAIRATIDMLLDYVGLTPDDLAQTLIAGAFGNFINPASALRMGLLADVPVETISGIGNAAGAGAILALISRSERQYGSQVARNAEHIELFRMPEFQMMFAESMMFE